MTDHPRRIALVGVAAEELALAVAVLPGRPFTATSVVGPTTIGAAEVEALVAAEVLVIAGAPGQAERAAIRRVLVMAATAGIRHCCIVPLRIAASAVEPLRLFAIAAGMTDISIVPVNGDAAVALAAALRALPPARELPLRLAVETGAGQVLSGRVLSGAPAVGVEVVLLPGAGTARIVGAETAARGDGEPGSRLTLDREIGAKPGQVLAASLFRPEVADQVQAHVIWLDGQPLLPGRGYTAELLGQTSGVQVGTLKHRINVENLDHIAARRLEAGEIGVCNLSFERPLVFDPFEGDRATGRIIVRDKASGRVVGVALIDFALRRATNIHWQALAVDKSARAELKGQQPCCLWFTGLSGSGKSTVASLLEKRLHALGRHTYTLDGDNVRHGLNRDLGFTDADRVENIRRVAEVAKLFVESGVIVMVSFISPFRAERRMARELFKDGEFLEIFTDTPLAVCESRDPKGLYKKARAGQLKNFTGIDSVYEPPAAAEIVLASADKTPEALVEDVLSALGKRGRI